jgi:hypothetical protein
MAATSARCRAATRAAAPAAAGTPARRGPASATNALRGLTRPAVAAAAATSAVTIAARAIRGELYFFMRHVSFGGGVSMTKTARTANSAAAVREKGSIDSSGFDRNVELSTLRKGLSYG